MNADAKTRRWFDWWRSRATFIEALDPIENFYEANALEWAALDALAGRWARCLHPDLRRGNERRRFGEFLSQLGGANNAFRRVSLPALWALGEALDPADVTSAVRDRLRQIGGRRAPTVLEERQVRMLNDDPAAEDVLRQLADIEAHVVRSRLTVRDLAPLPQTWPSREGSGKCSA